MRLTSAVFFWHMSGLAFIAMNRVIAPAFYARGDTKTPTWAGLVSVGVNVALAFVLVGPLKAPGIALALAGASAVNTLVLVVALIALGIPALPRPWPRAGRYSLKLLLFSCLCRRSDPRSSGQYWARLASWNVSLAAGVSLAATSLAFGGLGIALLA